MSFFLNTTVCGFSLYHILAFFLIYSCLGWCVEVVYAAATTGQLVNRGFLNGPVCPIYGFGMILVLFFLTPLEDDLLLLYLGGVILPSALELVGGWALYKLYRTRWWDYTDKPFNIGGYVCLEFSLMWGVGAMVMVKVIHPTIAALVNIIPPLVGFVLMCLLYAVYAADVVATAIAASDLARELDALEKVADSMHAVSDAMTEILGTTALDMDQKMDESRLQLKLAAAEARDSYDKLSPREAASTMRTRADEAMEAARRASQTARLNAAEAARASSWPRRARPSRPPHSCSWNSSRKSWQPVRRSCTADPPRHPSAGQGPYAPRLPQAEARSGQPLSQQPARAARGRISRLLQRIRTSSKDKKYWLGRCPSRIFMQLKPRDLPGKGRRPSF